MFTDLGLCRAGGPMNCNEWYPEEENPKETYTMLSVYFWSTDLTVSAFSRTKVSRLCSQLLTSHG